MKTPKKLTYIIFSLTILSFIIPETISAIPAFARRYKVSCTTCHTVFPKLKDYGDEFAGNGFIMKESEKERDYITAGDDLLWLNKDFPLAARMEALPHMTKEKMLRMICKHHGESNCFPVAHFIKALDIISISTCQKEEK